SGFITQVYLPDVCAIGALYADWLPYGKGVTNYLAVPDLPLDTKGSELDLPGGTIFDGDLSTAKGITSFEDPYFKENVTECVAHSWYQGDAPRHPWEGETVPHYTDFDPHGKYSWVKSPRFGASRCRSGPSRRSLWATRPATSPRSAGPIKPWPRRAPSPRRSFRRRSSTRPSGGTWPARSGLR